MIHIATICHVMRLRLPQICDIVFFPPFPHRGFIQSHDKTDFSFMQVLSIIPFTVSLWTFFDLFNAFRHGFVVPAFGI